MKLRIFIISCLLFLEVSSQVPDSIILNQDAILGRPFITAAKLGNVRAAIGGYLEGNTNYAAEDGVTEGFTMEMRRFNIFLFSSLNPKVRMISELEFEHGTEEIALETALLDFTFHHAYNFRAGVLLPQIGLVNANHDSPLWDFIERPASSTMLIPTTLSEIGFGVFGKLYPGEYDLSYDFYVLNGLDEGLILNNEGKTHLPSGKGEEMLGEDNNGEPMVNCRVSLGSHHLGEAGASYYGGVYNSYRVEGAEVEKRHHLDLYALDIKLKVMKIRFRGEVALASIGIPSALDQVYGKRQWAFFGDAVYPVMTRKMLGYDDAVLNLLFRFERMDFNVGTFDITGQRIGDEVSGFRSGFSFRPNTNTVFKANIGYHRITDILGNPPARRGEIQFGIASYF